MAYAGDLNSDGFDDVLIGANGFDGTADDYPEGQVYGFFGPVVGAITTTEADITLHGENGPYKEGNWIYQGEAGAGGLRRWRRRR